MNSAKRKDEERRRRVPQQLPASRVGSARSVLGSQTAPRHSPRFQSREDQLRNCEGRVDEGHDGERSYGAPFDNS